MAIGTCIETDKQVATPITFVYWYRLQNLRCHICFRAIKTKFKWVTVFAYQSLWGKNRYRRHKQLVCSIPRLSAPYCHLWAKSTLWEHSSLRDMETTSWLCRRFVYSFQVGSPGPQLASTRKVAKKKSNLPVQSSAVRRGVSAEA